MPITKLHQPKEFKWNEVNTLWVKQYLAPRADALLHIFENEPPIESSTQERFHAFCLALESSAEGREFKLRMFKAWRSKKSRDSDNGKKLFTFNLSIKFGEALKKLAGKAAINATLESLIFEAYSNRKRHKQAPSAPSPDCTPKTDSQGSVAEPNNSAENTLEHSLLSRPHNDSTQREDSLNISDIQDLGFDVKFLATQEKSELIRYILKLKKTQQKTEQQLHTTEISLCDTKIALKEIENEFLS